MSSTLPGNYGLDELGNFKDVVYSVIDSRRELLTSSTPGARLRKSLYEKGQLSQLDDLEKRIDSFSPDCVYERIDMNDPFKKRGLLMKTEVQQRLKETLSELFFYESHGQNTCRDTLLIEAASREERAKHTIIQSKYVNSNTMYLVEKGKAVISDRKRIVRRLTAPITYLEWLEQGGETKDVDIGPSNASILLHSCERNPTLRCIADSIFWSLTRDDFRGIVSLISVAACIQRCTWLALLPEISGLCRNNIIKLVNNLKSETWEEGGEIYSKNKIGSKVILIESGIARIELSSDIVAMKMSKEEVDDYLGIIRPAGNGRLCVNDMNTSQLVEFMRFHSSQNGEDLTSIAPCESIPVDPYALPTPENICELTPGCIVGASILRGKAQYSGDNWNWLNSRFVDEMWNGDVAFHGKSVAGAKYPLTLTSSTSVRCQSFSVELYEQLFGKVEDLFESSRVCIDGLVKQVTTENTPEVAVELTEGTNKAPNQFSSRFSYNNFKNAITLRHGTFGEIIVAEYKESAHNEEIIIDGNTIEDKRKDSYASEISGHESEVDVDQVFVLKLSQSTSAVDHLKNEYDILQKLSHPYIIKIFGFVDASRNLDGSKVATISEVLYSGDLWDVLHYGSMDDVLVGDDYNYEVGKGLPLELIKFYCASITFAMEHIHSKGIMYRNLKPENVLLDAKGQIRLVDFAYAKDMPSAYTSPTSPLDRRNFFSFQEHCLLTRSFTLCGTPEYMAPEIIYGGGHDWAVDIWAFGILMFELFTGHTPFEAVDVDGNISKTNISEIFKNIAGNDHNNVLTTRTGDIKFNESPDSRQLGILVQNLCQHDSWKRPGYLSGSIRAVLDYSFFDAVELDLVERARHPAKYLPPCRQSVYKAYVDYIATNKSLVVDDYVQYKMNIPREESYESDIDFDDFSDL